MFELFDDPQLDWDAARAIGKVVSRDNVLTKKNHAIVRVCNFSKPYSNRRGDLFENEQVLYAQKFFNSVLPRILTGAKVADRE